jgi:branched-chain amino acid transport system permease protein
LGRGCSAKERLGAVGAGAATLLVFPLVVHDRFMLNTAVFVALYTILASGLVLLFGYARQVSFGHAGFYGVGAYVSALAARDLHWSVWFGILAGAGVATLVGYVVGRPILRLRGLSLAMATFAFGVIANVVFTQLEVTGGANGLSGIPVPQIGAIKFDTPGVFYWIAVPVATLVMIVSRNIAHSHVGRALRALGNSEAAARVSGIDAATYKSAVFTYSAGVAGLAGALYAHYLTFVSENSFSINVSILMVVMIAVGGMQSLRGALLGAVFLAVVPEFLRQLGGSYAMLLYGALLTVVFMYLPDGVAGVLSALIHGGGLWRRRSSN